MATGRRNETLTLKGGQLLALSQPPGEKWRISSIERYAPAEFKTVSAPNGAGRTLVGVLSTYSMPEEWADMRFDSTDEAA
ncbi:MAG TPA: hypothetical protein VH394_14010, partial [Thermoanaerobaculia bacterium]|nr:hypothetical protein [Thermoanaerobaculia bacterium]